MSLHADLKQEIQKALKEKDEPRLTVIRGLVSAFTNEVIANGKKPSEELSDEDVLAVIKRQIKQRRDSIEQFSAGNREDLASKEETELAVLEPYLPTMAGKDEIRNVAEQKMTELGMQSDDASQKGALIGAVMKEMKGNADGADVKAVVDELFGLN